MWRLLLATFALALTAGCSFDPRGTTSEGADSVDADLFDADPNAPDADPTLPDASLCAWQGANFDPCALPAPMSGSVPLNNSGMYIYDTDAGTLVEPDGTPIDHAQTLITSMTPPVRAMIVDGFEIGGDAVFEVRGEHPLLIVSWDEIDVRGRIDIGASRGGTIPAGSNPAGLCDAQNGQDGNNGSGGGGGGGFQGKGGDGGQADGNGTERNGGPGGAAVTAPPQTPRGGCDGGNGGDEFDQSGNQSGAGGAGGGAIQLSAQVRVRIREDARFDGRGAGGTRGSTTDGGGGGGGSGSWIGLDAPDVQVIDNAIVAANGGGGGSGASLSLGSHGEDGIMGTAQAQGGTNSSQFASDGADGGANTVLAGQDAGALPDGGAGAGGGAAGFVVVWGTLTNTATISPTPTMLTP